MAQILLFQGQEGNLVALKSCEILDELRKLGITATADVIQYLRDYTTYYSTYQLVPEQEED